MRSIQQLIHSYLPYCQQCRPSLPERSFNLLRSFRIQQRSCSVDHRRVILAAVKDGTVGIDEALRLLPAPVSSAPSSDDQILSSFANLDHGRSRRTGFPEAIFAQSKTPEQVAKLLDDMARSVNVRNVEHGHVKDKSPIIATRVSEDMYNELAQFKFKNGTIQYHANARIVSMTASSERSVGASHATTMRIVVVTAGTTDIPVAEEAAITLELSGCEVDRINDCGVAGLHRIIRALPRLNDARVGCIIVCAGMDGALPSVVGGLVSVPVISVPTSIGYGASFGGISAMLTMLNSCSPGVGVVNIDNGFGAAALAWKFVNRMKLERDS